MKKNYAAIDLGSNSCRLLIADGKRNKLFSASVATKLAEGLYSSGKLSDASIKRAIDTFCMFAEELKNFDVSPQNIRAVATAACRMASNSSELQKSIKQKTGINLEIIDEKEEAELNLLGAISNIHENSKYAVVFDIGGGSTEITLATNTQKPKILHTISIPLGARNASEGYDLSQYNTKKAEKLVSQINKYTKSFIDGANFAKYADDVCFVATSSTPLRIASMIDNKGRYNREDYDGKNIDIKEADKAIAKTYEMSVAQMSQSPYIGENRSTIFVSACTIFQTITHNLGAKSVTASLMSAKEGIIQELMEKEYEKINGFSKANSR